MALTDSQAAKRLCDVVNGSRGTVNATPPILHATYNDDETFTVVLRTGEECTVTVAVEE